MAKMEVILSRLRIMFIISLLVLVGLFISVIYFIPPGTSLTETQRLQIIKAENEWILQCDITNSLDTETEYSITVTVDGAVSRDSAVIQPGDTYTYIHHIYPQQLTEGKVVFALYQEGINEPVEQATYYLDTNGYVDN